MGEISKYENLHKFLDYRTSNLGLLKYEDHNIFSYINAGTEAQNFTDGGVEINNTISDITNITTEQNIEEVYMKTLIFNTDIINFISGDTVKNKAAARAANYILDITENKFSIGDFGDNLEHNARYYKYGMINTPIFDPENKDIIDVDLSYYASDHIIKFLFYLDVLIELYDIIDKNKETREGMLNSLKELTVKSRYYLDGTKWKLYDKKHTLSGTSSITSYSYYNIIFDSLIPSIKRDKATGAELPPEEQDTIEIITVKSVKEFIETDLKPKLTTENALTMITPFNKALLKHINFIKGADMIYANNFRDYYKLCRLLLTNTILSSVNYIIHTNIINHEDITNTATIKEYDYLYDELAEGESETKDFTNTSKITELPGQVITGVKNPMTGATANSTFRLIETIKYEGKNNNDTYTKPSGMICKYIVNRSELTSCNLKIKINSDTLKLESIENLEFGRVYYIRLHNVCLLSSTYTNSFEVNEDGTTPYIKWDESKKTLLIKRGDTFSGTSVNISSKDLYLLSIENNKEITLPSNAFNASFTSKPKIYIPTATALTLVNGTTQLTDTHYEFDATTKMLTLKVAPPEGSTTNYKINDVSLTLDESVSIYSKNKIINTDSVTNIGELEPRFVCIRKLDYPTTSLLINNYNRANPDDRFGKNFTIKVNDTDKPYIEPVSYENDISELEDFTNNKFTTSILGNFKDYSSTDFTKDTETNDEIINSMNNLATINQDLSKRSTTIKKNYNEFESEHSKVLSSNVVEIVAIIILVLTIFTAMYLPLSKLDKNNSMMISGAVFLIVVITYIIITIIINIKYKGIIDAYQNYSAFKATVDSITLNLINNLYNQRTRISQDVILPSLKKEEDYFSKKNDKFKIYTGRTYGDLQIVRRTRQKNIARITFMLEIAMIVGLSLLLYSIRPQWLNVILSVAFILAFISLFLLFVRLTNVVHTNSKNKYWTRPDPALEKLKYSGGAMML